MSSRRKKRQRQSPGSPKPRPSRSGAWQPLEQGYFNPEFLQVSAASGVAPPLAVYMNDLYQVTVHQVGDGPLEDSVLHLSIKRDDRSPIHDWRHLQAIKNEICGPESMAFEIYPQESKLVDTSNQYHLWVLPESYELPFGFDEYLVSSDAQVAMFNEADHKGRQRPFQEGLPVALTRNSQPGANEDMHAVHLKGNMPMKSRVPR